MVVKEGGSQCVDVGEGASRFASNQLFGARAKPCRDRDWGGVVCTNYSLMQLSDRTDHVYTPVPTAIHGNLYLQLGLHGRLPKIIIKGSKDDEGKKKSKNERTETLANLNLGFVLGFNAAVELLPASPHHVAS